MTSGRRVLKYVLYQTVPAISDSAGHIRQCRPYQTVLAISDSAGHIRQCRPYQTVPAISEVPAISDSADYNGQCRPYPAISDSAGYIRQCRLYQTVPAISDSACHIRQCRLYQTVPAISDSAGHIRQCRPYQTVPAISEVPAISDSVDYNGQCRPYPAIADSAGYIRQCRLYRTVSTISDSAGHIRPYQTVPAISDSAGYIGQCRLYRTVPAISDSAGYIRQCRPYQTVPAISDSAGHIRQCRLYQTVPAISDSAGHIRQFRLYQTVPAISDSAGYIRQCRPYQTVPTISDSAGHIRPYQTVPAISEVPAISDSAGHIRQCRLYQTVPALERYEVSDLDSSLDSDPVTPSDNMALSEPRGQRVTPVMTTDCAGDVTTSSAKNVNSAHLTDVYINNNSAISGVKHDSVYLIANAQYSVESSNRTCVNYNHDNTSGMGTSYSISKNDTGRAVSKDHRTFVNVGTLSVRSILAAEKIHRSKDDMTDPSEFAGVVASIEHDNALGTSKIPRTMYASDSTTEARRRNFSSSSLPVNLMTATIEEVDDADQSGAPPVSYSGQRSYSYSGTGTPSPKVPSRALRREAHVPSLNSPPRSKRPAPLVQGLVKSPSDHTNKVGNLKDLDIVGESFESRYPWQKDVAIQCYLQNDCPCHPNLHRAMSGPAMYTYFRSLSLSSNSPTSSPPLTARRPPFQAYGRSSSHSDLMHHYIGSGSISDMPPTHLYQRHAALSRSNSNITPNGLDASVLAASYNNNSSKRTNFWRRPRPSSMGAVENIRYQHELTKFRELHNLRRDRKSDPQLVVSPGCRRRMPEESGSISDLESILENPSDR
ncbi:hypothetical protein Btru_025887, partial [Bulinus truncatus]